MCNGGFPSAQDRKHIYSSKESRMIYFLLWMQQFQLSWRRAEDRRGSPTLSRGRLVDQEQPPLASAPPYITALVMHYELCMAQTLSG